MVGPRGPPARRLWKGVGIGQRLAVVGLHLLLFALISALLAPGAYAHDPGAEPLHVMDQVALAPAGSEGDRILLSFISLGLPVDAGDRLEFSWFVDGGAGAQVLFEIQDQTAGLQVLHSGTSNSGSGSLTFSGPGRYMLFLQNPTDFEVQVWYDLELLPPPGESGLTLTDYAVLTTLATAAALMAILIWRGRRKRLQPSEE